MDIPFLTVGGPSSRYLSAPDMVTHGSGSATDRTTGAPNYRQWGPYVRDKAHLKFQREELASRDTWRDRTRGTPEEWKRDSVSDSSPTPGRSEGGSRHLRCAREPETRVKVGVTKVQGR